MRIAEEALTKQPKRRRGRGASKLAREKAMKEAIAKSYHAKEEGAEERQTKWRALIKLGRDRGYLTYAELNDYLPETMVEQDDIDQVVATLSDLNIQVYDQAPDAESMLLNDNAVTDSDSDDEADAALSSMDGDSAARRIRSACTCAKWVLSNCSRVKVKSLLPAGLKTVSGIW